MDRKINWKEIIKAENVVKVRQWDDMVREYGAYHKSGGALSFPCVLVINCYKEFTEDMKKYCGKTIRISGNMEKCFKKFKFFFYDDNMFSADMLEPYIVTEEEKTRKDIENHEIKIEENTFMDRKKINWGSIIKEGNAIKIRQFDDMAKEFGTYYERGNSFCEPCKVIINCFKLFNEKMKKYCGKIIKVNSTMEIEFNLCGYFHYEGYSISTDMLEPYAVCKEEKKEEKGIIIPNIKNHGIKETAIYVIEYNNGADNFITFKGKIINFTNDKCFIVDEKEGLAILNVKNIISMIPY